MQQITQQQLADILQKAAHLDPTIHTSERFITFGINADGREFVAISYGVEGKVALGTI